MIHNAILQVWSILVAISMLVLVNNVQLTLECCREKMVKKQFIKKMAVVYDTLYDTKCYPVCVYFKILFFKHLNQ